MADTLLIRADASPHIGSGHVMRCLALAQAWQRTGRRVVFAQTETTPALEKRLQAEGVEVARLATTRGDADDSVQTLELALTLGATWLVADGYCFGAAWQLRIREGGMRLLVIDDYGHSDGYHADLILNQNASANEQLYALREPTTRLLLGTRYALLRREFLACGAVPRVFPAVARKILVTLGGTDPDNVTARVIGALAHLTDIEAVVVVGGSNPHLAAIKQTIGPSNPLLRLVVDTTKMPELMAWADMAVSAAGSTAWELVYMGLPAMLLVTADNQAGIAEVLARKGISVSLGSTMTLTAEVFSTALGSLMVDQDRRREMGQRARELIDGDGTARVVTRLLAAQIKLRRAHADDCRLFWDWVNDPAVRSSAFNSETIPWEAHQCWFDHKLSAANATMFVGSVADGMPSGQVRFELDGADTAQIDVSVGRPERHSGIGSALIRRAVDEFFATTHVATVKARIKTANPASIRAFEKAGFTRTSEATMSGCEVVQLRISAHE